MVAKTEILKNSKNWSAEALYPDIAKIIDTPHYTSPKFTHGDVPIITTSQCSHVGIDYTNSDFTSHEEYEKRRQVIDPDVGDILFTREAPAGISVLVDRKEIVVGQRIVLLKTNKKRINNRFLVYFLNSHQNKKQLDFLSIKTTVERINIEEIKKLLIPVISLPEQEKISQMLFNIDELIKKLKTLIEKKKNVKQGTIQELLSGKRRLKGFKEKWETKTLGDLAEIIKGQGLSKNKIHPEGKHKCILYGELYTTYSRIIKKIISLTNRFEGTLSRKGDILIPSSTTTKGIDLATASALFEEDVLLGGDINVIRAKTKCYDSLFLSNYLTHIAKNKIANMAQGITIIHLYKKNLEQLELTIPKDPEEQTAIVKILTDMDDEIYELEYEIDKYIKIKNGMMQKLLTGEIRLK